MAAHRYWRLLSIDYASGSWTGFPEMEMRTSVGGSDVTDSAYAIEGGHYSSNSGDRAFDDNISTWWNIANGQPDENKWVGQDFGSGNEQDIVEISITSRDHSSYFNQTPTEFKIQHSDDGTTWTDALHVEGEATWTREETRTYEITAPVAPTNDTPPTVSGNTPIGSVLTSGDGSWSGSPTPSYSYAWYRSGVAISGATSSTYRTVIADAGAVISSQVTATNAAGSASQASSNSITVDSLPTGDTENYSDAETFMLTTRLNSPLGTLESINYNGASAESYGAWIAPADMTLRHWAMNVTRSGGLRQDLELFVIINDGTEISIGSELATFEGISVFNDVDISISEGDKVEIVYTCGNNFNMSIGASFWFETDGNETTKPFLIQGEFDPVTSGSVQILFGGNSHNYNLALPIPQYCVLEKVTYWCQDGDLDSNHTLTLTTGGEVISIGTAASGSDSFVFDLDDIEIPAGNTITAHASHAGGTNQHCRMTFQLRSAGGTPYSGNTFVMAWNDTDIEAAQTVSGLTIPTNCTLIGVSFSHRAASGNASTIDVSINGGTAQEVLDYNFVGPSVVASDTLAIELSEGDTLEILHNGTGATGLGGVTALFFYVDGDEPPVEPDDPTEWPDELPPGNLSGASGGPQSNKISFEPEYGPSIDRRKGSYAARMISITLPPLTQSQYETWQTFFYETLKNGSLAMTFPDPMTKTNRRFKFKQNKPVIREKSASGGLIEISFDLIRID